MIPYLSIGSSCIACDNCVPICPEDAIVSNLQEYTVDSWTCTLCQLCIEVCPVDCIKVITTSSN